MTDTTEGPKSSLPPRPPPSVGRHMPSLEGDFWAGLFSELAVRVEWLAQAVEAVPKEDASAAAIVRLGSYARALQELHTALGNVHTHRRDPHLKPLFALEGPLAGYISRLYGWCDQIGDDFERMAVALRRAEPTSTVFSHHAVNESYAEFAALILAMRQACDKAREGDAATWRTFDAHLEELIWATEWVHMTLARRPGD